MNSPSKNTHEAQVIMVSHGLGPAVRSTFSSVWSKLYQWNEYLIDVELKPEGNSALLQGQVMTEGAFLTNDALVHLFDNTGSHLESHNLGETGDFTLALDQIGNYQIGIEFEAEMISLNSIEAK